MYDHQKDTFDPKAFAAISLTSAAEVAAMYPGLRKMKVRKVGFTVTTSPTVTAAIISFRQRITPRSATGQMVITTLTIPVAAVIGTTYYKEGLNFDIPPGDELQVEVTQVATAGAGVLHVESEPVWETSANNVNMIASA